MFMDSTVTSGPRIRTTKRNRRGAPSLSGCPGGHKREQSYYICFTHRWRKGPGTRWRCGGRIWRSPVSNHRRRTSIRSMAARALSFGSRLRRVAAADRSDSPSNISQRFLQAGDCAWMFSTDDAPWNSWRGLPSAQCRQCAGPYRPVCRRPRRHARWDHEHPRHDV